MNDKVEAEREAAEKDVTRLLAEVAAEYPTFIVWSLVLGDYNLIHPTKDIGDVLFEFLGTDGKTIPFECDLFRITTTSRGTSGFERRPALGQKYSRCFNEPRDPGFRTYMMILVMRGERPMHLKVRVEAARTDDCEVHLRESGVALVTKVAMGEDWHTWRIPE